MTKSNKETLPPMMDVNIDFATAFGTSDTQLQKTYTLQLFDTLWSPPAGSTDLQAATAALASLEDIRPRDVFERQLATLMVATYNAAMKFLKHAAASQTPEGADMYARMAMKSISAYERLLDAPAPRQRESQRQRRKCDRSGGRSSDCR